MFNEGIRWFIIMYAFQLLKWYKMKWGKELLKLNNTWPWCVNILRLDGSINSTVAAKFVVSFCRVL
jgi:hypothetical protein